MNITEIIQCNVASWGKSSYDINNGDCENFALVVLKAMGFEHQTNSTYMMVDPFDDFDDRWKVTSKPNHVHPRYQEKATKSPFTGNPSKDITILCGLLRSGNIYAFGLE